MKLHIAVRIRIYFLKSCIKYDLTPSHLTKSIKHITFYFKSSWLRLNRINKKSIDMICRLEITDAYNKLRNIQSEMYRISKAISLILLYEIDDDFYFQQELIYYRLWTKEKTRINNKIDWLSLKKKRQKISSIKPINYYCKMSNSINRTNLLLPLTSTGFNYSLNYKKITLLSHTY